MKKIIIDDAVSYAEPIFSTLGEVICVPGKEIHSHTVKDADALIVRSRTQVNEKLLEGNQIEFVGSTVVGLDHIDQTYLKEANIHFYSAQGCNANSVSEFIITNLINLAEQQNFQLKDRSVGIIGVGHVGKLVESKARALGMTIFLNDPPRAEHEGLDRLVDLNTALSADIITFHTPLTFEGCYKTHHLLNPQNFHLIKPNAIVINAARGGIIDEKAWCQTTTQANIIDCWENEPFTNSELYSKATIATPHIAGHALDGKIKGSTMVYNALCQFWSVTPDNKWEKQLPDLPHPITPIFSSNTQQVIYQILKQCYRPEDDDQAIRANDIDTVYKKFEYYRRHYPIHREWTEHRVYSTANSDQDELLSNLGFKVINS